MTLGIIPDSARNGQLAHYNAPMRGTLARIESRISAYRWMVFSQIVLTMPSCFVRPADMVDTLRTSSSGSTARLVQSRAELAPLQIVTIDAPMISDRLRGAQSNLFYNLFLFLPCPTGINISTTMTCNAATFCSSSMDCLL